MQGAKCVIRDFPTNSNYSVSQMVSTVSLSGSSPSFYQYTIYQYTTAEEVNR